MKENTSQLRLEYKCIIIDLFGEKGFKVYRVFIAWTRIFSNWDEETTNEEGLKFYEELFKECYKYGIEPLVDKCQAIHHELVASALATKITHEVDPNK